MTSPLALASLDEAVVGAARLRELIAARNAHQYWSETIAFNPLATRTLQMKPGEPGHPKSPAPLTLTAAEAARALATLIEDQATKLEALGVHVGQEGRGL